MKENTAQRGTLTAVLISSFLIAYMGSSITIVLPLIGDEFSLPPSFLGWIAMVYLLSTAVFLLPAGMGADLRGRKKFFLAGSLLTVLASVGCALAPNGASLLLARVSQGAGAALIFSTSSPLVATAFPPEQRGKALGISIAAVYLGLSAGPFLGGLLSHLCGWRTLFQLNALGMLAAAAVGHRMIVPDPAPSPGRIDLAGSSLCAAAVVCGMLGLTWISTPKGLPLLLLGALLLAWFLTFELRAASPLLPVTDFRRNRVFLFSNLASMINYSSTFAISFFLSLYLQYVKGYTPDIAGLALMAQPLVQSLFSPAAGRLSDRYNPRLPASAGMALIAAALLVFALYPGVMPIGVIIILLVILGLGFALFSSPNTNAILGSVARQQLGIASSVMGMTRMLGQAISMAIAIFLLAHFVGDSRVDAANTPAFLQAARLAFIIFALLCLIGIPASWARGGTTTPIPLREPDAP